MFVANHPRPGNDDVPVGDYSSLFPSSSTFSLLVSPFPRAYPLYFDILAHSFARSFLLSYFESIGSALFAQNHPGWGYPPVRSSFPPKEFPKGNSPHTRSATVVSMRLKKNKPPRTTSATATAEASSSTQAAGPLPVIAHRNPSITHAIGYTPNSHHHFSSTPLLGATTP